MGGNVPIVGRDMSTDAIERTPPREESIEREIGHDEFDPYGTLTLLALYFLILVGMWLFTYFVEFAGRGPTVIG